MRAGRRRRFAGLWRRVWPGGTFGRAQGNAEWFHRQSPAVTAPLQRHRWNAHTITFLALFLGFGVQPAVSQGTPGAGVEPGEGLRVYVMTMGPGEFIWERFGHNAIRVRDEARGTDIAYNYGMFSFEQEDFVLRFIRGNMDYWMEGFDTGLTANAYISTGRAVWMQELNLTPAERLELQQFLEWNSLPENRFYRYDYYLDNCSTRVRDAIDRVLGGQIREQTAELPSGQTFRDHTRMLTADDPLVYAGLMAGLGEPVDREISVWEEMFLPMQVREHFQSLTIAGPGGERVPLLLAEETIYRGDSPIDESLPPARIPFYLAAGVVIGGLLWVSGASVRRQKAARVAFTVVGTAWAVIAGTLGVVLLGLWLFTDHVTSYRNENLFFLSPLLVPLIGLIPAAAGRGIRARPLAFQLSVAVAAISLLGLVLKLLPALDQWNGEMIALALPINLGLVLGLWRIRTERDDVVDRAFGGLLTVVDDRG